MYYKLSNTAEGSMLEKEFGIPLQYNELYEPSPLINGLNEETILAITAENQFHISPAIWGMLPEEFVDEWNIFQGVSNTLNISGDEIWGNSWKSQSLLSRRCLIIVTGFFTAYLHNGTIYPYYVGRTDKRPFTIAGIYNRLEDGFLTCSILTQRADNFISKIHNLGDQMPVVLNSEFSKDWLKRDLDETRIASVIKNPCSQNLEAYLIAKEFYNQNITYDSMLEPVSYKNLRQIVKP